MDTTAVTADALDRYHTALTAPLLDVPESACLAFGRDWVLSYLPHRPPFVFIDGVQRIQDGVICARFDVDQTPDIFASHFPGVPRWPGVLQIEAMAQAALTLYLFSLGHHLSEVALGVVREARFSRQVVPGRPVQLMGSFVEDGLFVALVGQTLQAGRVCSACLLSIVPEVEDHDAQ